MLNSSLFTSVHALVIAAASFLGLSAGISLSAETQDMSHANMSHEGTARADFSYEPQPVTYPRKYTIFPRIGDGTDAQGGLAPAYKSKQPLNIRSEFPLGSWLTTAPSPPDSPNGEAKFRTLCNYSHNAYDDPIVFPGQPGAAHLHTFLGNTLTDANSTYRSLRTRGGSTCGGGPINRSAYWYPAVLKDNAIGDGKRMIVKPDFAVVYYTVDEIRTARVSRIPRGLSYVFGFNPSDPNDSAQRNEVAAAGGDYSYFNNGFRGWKCEQTNGANVNSPVPGNPVQPYLQNADGTATLTCPKNQRIGAALSGPDCWDGHNLTSPNGRKHVRQYIRNNASGRQDLCPNGWYYIARFQLVIWFSHEGVNDYKRWYLSSDRMPGMPRFLNGQSMHADWFGAWDYDFMKAWMINCNGTKIPGGGRPKAHSCADTQFGDGRKGISGGPAPDLSRNPQISLMPQVSLGDGRFDPLPVKR